MIIRATFLFGLFLLIPSMLYGQFNDQEIDLESFAESLFQIQDDDINYGDLYESLLMLYTNPINLNKASREDLESLYQLDNGQIETLINYIADNGPLISIYELQAVPGFDSNTIKGLAPFVTIEERPSDTRPLIQRILSEENNYLLMRTERTIESREGFEGKDSSDKQMFLGGKSKDYMRFRVSRPDDFSLGFSMEKDVGERYLFDNQKHQFGPDFLSFHFLLKNKSRFKTIALGDYQLQFGQGLVMGAGFNPGKGSEAITTIRRSSTGVLPYSSVLESGFYRGAAVTYSLGYIEVTGFYSRQFQDASFKNDTTFTDYEEFVSSIQETGFHRTQREFDSKNQLNETIAGGVLMYRSSSNRLQGGLTFMKTAYGTPIFKKPNTYNRFEFQGSNNYNAGFFANYQWQNLSFFGEGAVSESGGIGAVGGMVASIARNTSFSVVLRNYEKNFHSFKGNAFGETSRNINERGIYWGLKIKPLHALTITSYFDRFAFPWLRLGAAAPSTGDEYLIRMAYSMSRNSSIYAQFRQERKERTSSVEVNSLSKGIKRNYAINLHHQAGKVTMRSRLQWSSYSFEQNVTKGFAIVQDFNFDLNRIVLGTRFALFDTDDFENRQYAYEKDVLYAFSIPAYSGVGIRNYILVQFKASRKLTFWGRLARTVRSDVDQIGSGLNQIKANHQTDVKLQLRYNF
ncbi:MAG: helix-hairpin-helix domain-containing protein [Bacteroidetes bacterium]|nr:helix-hairpin-helix domain-containing protein [Bacteroidota bacterium]MDA1119160.1 helix-hairpin-helix domain-containing protein [Bacteroidota bacterium]